MTLEGKYLAVNVRDDWTKEFLGLHPQTTAGRWSAWGVCVGETSVGLAVELDELQERKGWSTTPVRTQDQRRGIQRVSLVTTVPAKAIVSARVLGVLSEGRERAEGKVATLPPVSA